MDVERLEYLLSPPEGPRHVNRLTHHVQVIAFLALMCFLTTFYILSSQSTKGYISLERRTRGDIIKERLARPRQTADNRHKLRGSGTKRSPNPDSRRPSQAGDQRDQLTGTGTESLFSRRPDSRKASQKAGQSHAISSAATDIILGSRPETTTLRDTLNTTGYLVLSPSCRMPDTPPFHESIKRMYKKKKEQPCSTKPPLTSVSRSHMGNVLHLHKEHFASYKINKTDCCFTRIWRTDQDPSKMNYNADNVVMYGKCIKFYDNVTLNSKDEFLKVTCRVNKGKRFTDVYKNMHTLVGWKPQVNRKMMYFNQKRLESWQKPLSVMIIGLDNVSRKNLIRTMPKTVEHLERNGWIGLKGYNKIGENTFPNQLATLAGMTVKQITRKCWPTRLTLLDECPLIWKNFSQNGYITAYAEDEPWMSTFNYAKTGFGKSPTDYYLRPFMKAAPTTRRYDGLVGCIGPVTPTQHILNYSINFATAFNKYPTFSLFWLNAMHENLNRPTTIDGYMKHYFEKNLKDSGALNTTMVIFMSDHGMRFGKIRETYVGYIEERLPFMYFWLPEWFKTAHPTKVDNLVRNTNRLTSPFDVYLTLSEVLGVQTVAEGCPNCTSLFKEVPWNRSCTDAGIPDHWCTCAETFTKSSAPAMAIAKFVVKEVNKILGKYTADVKNGMRCSHLQVKKVLSVRSKIFSKANEEFVIIVQTSPGNATFEATVSHKSTYKIIDSISRINSYGEQSKCIDNYYAKNYCFCEMVPEKSTTLRAKTTR